MHREALLILIKRILTALALLAPGFAGAELLLEPGADLTPPPRLTVAQEQADMQALVEAARDGYAGPDLAAALTGFALRDEAPLDFCRRLQEKLAAQSDAHSW